MPEQHPAPVIQDIDLEQGKLALAFQDIREAFALKLVNQTFNQYERYRQANYDRQWQTNDALYMGWMQQKMWPGSPIPRSSLSMPLVFDQIEAAMPAITQALFGQPDWFSVESDVGGNPEEARGVQEHLQYVLDHDKDGFGLSSTTELTLSIKSMLMYGNGGVHLEWDEETKRPSVSWVDIRDIYFDPGARTPAVDHCRSVIRRVHKTVEEVIAWRGNESMKIPSDEILWNMAKSRPFAVADQTKQLQNSLSGVNYQPGFDDVLPNPADQQIEVLMYYSKSRMIMILNREWVAFSGNNPYGFIPFAFAPCYTILGRFQARSIADVQEGNQKYAEALMNGYIDEIHLAQHPPRIQKASSMMTPAQQRWGPGTVLKVQNPKEDMIMAQPTGMLTNVSELMDHIERMAEKRTGITSMGMGVPRGGNVNRTATGVQSQLSGGAARLQMLVSHIEEYLIIPMLYKLHKIIQVHMAKTETSLPGRNAEGTTIVNSQVFEQPVRFRVFASTKMMTREKLQANFPFIMQYLANGAFIQGIGTSGLTVDWQEMFRFLQDATGVAKTYTLIRPMNEQEQQAQNQPPPEMVAEKEKTQSEQQTRLQIVQMKGQQGKELEQMKNQKSPIDLQLEQQKVELEAQKMQMQLEMQAQKMELEQQKNEMTLQLKRMEMEMKGQQAQMDMYLKQVGAQQEVALESQRGSLEQQRMQQEHAISAQQSQEQAALTRETSQAQHTQNLSMMKEKSDAQTAARATAKPAAGVKTPSTNKPSKEK